MDDAYFVLYFHIVKIIYGTFYEMICEMIVDALKSAWTVKFF
jgi:hypothetical protein